MDIAEREDFVYADVDGLGSYTDDDSFDERHIEEVMNLELLDLESVKNRKFRVVVDSINSVGGVILPKLLDRLGVEYKFLNGEATGDFAHNPEPNCSNLTALWTKLPRVVMIWVSLLTLM